MANYQARPHAADTSGRHDDRYYTANEVDGIFSAFSPTTPDAIRDVIGTALVAGTSITVLVDAVADTITISVPNIAATQDAHIAATGAHGVATVAGLAEIQTLEAKTLVAPILAGSVTGTYTLEGTPTFPASVILTTGVQTLDSKTLTTPTIADYTNANHTHAGVLTGGVIAHTALTAIGTNTHDQIDTALATAATHQAASISHGATGAVVGTDNTQTLINKTLTTPTIAAAGFTNANHTHDGITTGGTIAHTALTSIGTNTHAQIDTALTTSASHIAATAAHGVTTVAGLTEIQTLTNKTLTTPTIVAAGFTNMPHTHAGTTTGGVIAHTSLTSIGTNTHDQIDTALTSSTSHIAATIAHGATGAVVGTDNTQTLINKTLTTPTIASLTNMNHGHTGVTTGGTIAHTALTSIGTNTHAQIDSALAADWVSINARRDQFAMQPLSSYNTFTHGLGQSGALIGVALSANVIYFTPMYLPALQSFDRIGINVTTAVAASSARLGIFTLDLSTGIATRQADFGTIATDTTGNKEFTTPFTLGFGWRWLAVQASHAISITGAAPAMGYAFSTPTQVQLGSRMRTGGTFVAFGTTETTTTNSTTAFSTWMRAS